MALNPSFTLTILNSRWSVLLSSCTPMRSYLSDGDGVVYNVSLVRSDGTRWPYEINYVAHITWTNCYMYFYPFTSEQKQDGSYPDRTDSFDDFFYDAGEKLYFEDPPGSGSSDACNPDKNSKFTGYTSGGEFCKRSSGAIDDEPHLAIHSGRIGVLVDALFSDGNLFPRMGLVSNHSSSSDHVVDPWNDLPRSSFGSNLTLTNLEDTHHPTGSYKLGLKSDRTFAETSLGECVSRMLGLGRGGSEHVETHPHF